MCWVSNIDPTTGEKGAVWSYSGKYHRIWQHHNKTATLECTAQEWDYSSNNIPRRNFVKTHRTSYNFCKNIHTNSGHQFCCRLKQRWSFFETQGYSKKNKSYVQRDSVFIMIFGYFLDNVNLVKE